MVILAKRVQELEAHLSEHDAALEKRDRVPITAFVRRLKRMLRLGKAREVKTTRTSAADAQFLEPPPYN